MEKEPEQILAKSSLCKGMTKEEILVHAGHTLLKAVSAWDEIQTLCEEAIENHTEEEGVAIMAEHIEYQMLEILKSLKK